jgi:hypothetical protein
MAASGHGTQNQEITTAYLCILVGWVSERSERNPTSCYYMVRKHFHPLLWATASVAHVGLYENAAHGGLLFPEPFKAPHLLLTVMFVGRASEIASLRSQ